MELLHTIDSSYASFLASLPEWSLIAFRVFLFTSLPAIYVWQWIVNKRSYDALEKLESEFGIHPDEYDAWKQIRSEMNKSSQSFLDEE